MNNAEHALSIAVYRPEDSLIFTVDPPILSESQGYQEEHLRTLANDVFQDRRMVSEDIRRQLGCSTCVIADRLNIPQEQRATFTVNKVRDEHGYHVIFAVGCSALARLAENEVNLQLLQETGCETTSAEYMAGIPADFYPASDLE